MQKNTGQNNYGLSELPTFLRLSTVRKYESSTTEKLLPQENAHIEMTPLTSVSVWGFNWCVSRSPDMYDVSILQGHY